MSYLDTRDLDRRLEELRSQRDDEEEPALDDEEREECEELERLEAEIGSEWVYGATMIPETDFTDYARELAEDIGAVPENAEWPASYIDWERAAEALAMDYITVEYEDTTYYVRA